MCGIAAYCGKQPAEPFLLSALAKLEYRGYDGYGYLLSNGESWVIDKQLDLVSKARPMGHPHCMGIAHTRWATHGKVSLENAHPIFGGKDVPTVAVVHNGIVENCQEIKDWLINEGYTFKTDTDTEVIAHLIDRYLSKYSLNNPSPLDIAGLIHLIVDQLYGIFAIAVVSTYFPKNLVLVSKGLSLVVSPDGFAASDASALNGFTDKYHYLTTDEIAVGTIDNNDMQIVNIREFKRIVPKWEVLTEEKPVDISSMDTYRYMMEKEIFEQADILSKKKPSKINFPAAPEKIVLFGCGSSYNVALLGKYYFEEIAAIPTEVGYASELIYHRIIQPANTLYIGITQSGETADTLFMLERLQARREHKLLCILNNVHSKAGKHYPFIEINAGKEVGVAATKTFTMTAVSLLKLAMQFAELQSMHCPTVNIEDLCHSTLPFYINEILKSDMQVQKIRKLAYEVSKFTNVLYLARYFNYPIAKEGALKLKEVAYIHAEAMPAAEMKHGPIALVNEDTLSVFILTNYQEPTLHAKVISNMQEIKARGGKILVVADTKTLGSVLNIADMNICIPTVHPWIQPILANIPLQLLSYYTAIEFGYNPDKPINLAKCVTVE